MQHAGLLLSAGLIVLCALRILILTRGDLALALAVLNVGQQFTILTSTLFTVLPLAALFAYFYPQSSQFLSINANNRKSLKFAGVHGLALALCGSLVFMVVPVVLLGIAIAALIIFVFAIIIDYLLTKGKRKRSLPDAIRQFFLWLVSCAVVVQVIVLLSTPWVPAERISVKNDGDNKTIYGYILGQQGKQSMVLNIRQNDVTWIGEDDLGERRLCNTNSFFSAWYWKPYLTAFTSEKNKAPQREDCGQ